MPDFHRRSTTTQSAALIVGGTAGALIRYAVATAWPNPQQMLVSTTLTAAVAFMVAGYLLATGMKCALHYLVFGVCVSACVLGVTFAVVGYIAVSVGHTVDVKTR